MENVINEQTEPKAQTATAEQSVGETAEEVSLGKFKDVNALLSAYNSLQAEFTKRCQRIKELESQKVMEKTDASNTLKVGESERVEQGITQSEKDQIVKDYLKSLLVSKQQAVILDGVGGGVNTPVSRPRTIAEASDLAKEILKQ